MSDLSWAKRTGDDGNFYSEAPIGPMTLHVWSAAVQAACILFRSWLARGEQALEE